jgi:hypothetical protein
MSAVGELTGLKTRHYRAGLKPGLYRLIWEAA